MSVQSVESCEKKDGDTREMSEELGSMSLEPLDDSAQRTPAPAPALAKMKKRISSLSTMKSRLSREKKGLQLTVAARDHEIKRLRNQVVKLQSRSRLKVSEYVEELKQLAPASQRKLIEKMCQECPSAKHDIVLAHTKDILNMERAKQRGKSWETLKRQTIMLVVHGFTKRQHQAMRNLSNKSQVSVNRHGMMYIEFGLEHLLNSCVCEQAMSKCAMLRIAR